ncbi:MAG: hypothetical protein ACYC0F_18335 [Rhodanobacter sp.]
MPKQIQTRSKTGVMQFKNAARNDWLKHQGIERKNIHLGQRVRKKTRFYTPGEIIPFIETFQINGHTYSGLNPGTHYRHAVHIAYTGGRQGDFVVANAAAGLQQTPAGHVWHHFHDWTPPLAQGGNGYGTLYLMTTAEHGVYHCGGVLQMETHSGTPYRP